MIDFNNFQIYYNGNKIIIDVSIKEKSYYENVYLDSITIDTQDTFIQGGPSSKACYTHTIDGNQKQYYLEITQNDLIPSLKENLFFVWVKAKGIPDPSTPCGEDNQTSLGILLWMYPIYKQVYCFADKIDCNNCNTDFYKSFIDLILKIKSLQTAILLGDSTKALKYYNKFFKDKLNTNLLIKKCNCNG